MFRDLWIEMDSPMKNVLMLNTHDLRGGAARATYRIFEGLLARGVEVNLLVQRKHGHHPRVLTRTGAAARLLGRLRPYADFLLPLLMKRNRFPFFPALLPDGLAPQIAALKPDLVHLNWVAEGFLHPATLPRLGKPVVWTCQDMWPFTGGCHYARDCQAYRGRCGRCPELRSRRATDLSTRSQQAKIAALAAVEQLVVVATSRWIADCARSSAIFAGREVVVIPNGLDTQAFAPQPSAAARRRHGLPEGRPIVLYGAADAVHNPLKGFAKLLEALPQLRTPQVMLVVFGAARLELELPPGYDVRFIDWVDGIDELAALYAAAEVMVVPSIQEAFGQTVTEALACGTPVVAFDATGPQDIVDHLRTGYLATPFEAADLAVGIDTILAGRQSEAAGQMRQRARQSAVDRFAIDKVAGDYEAVYDRLLEQVRKGHP